MCGRFLPRKTGGGESCKDSACGLESAIASSRGVDRPQVLSSLRDSQSPDSSSTILESKSVNKKQAQTQKSHREQLKLESTFTHNLDSSSKLRSLESPPSDTNQNRQPSNKSPNTTNYIGFYVDIGAHHPFRFSNTYALYKAGWSGINIDPMPKSMEKFRRFRPRDINLEIAIGASQDIKPYYIFEEKALNTFDESLARDYARSSRLVDVISIPCYPINAILARYASAPIDLLSIDVEGQDMAILSTLDFAVYAPRVVLAESFSQDLMRDPLVSFMRTKGYNLLAKTTRTCIFVRARI
ncbi:FkbM family methyltransferase [Helicobacter canis]|uniref:FkbM family methyltransferase n=1 Tax=Helicobacter canis TaxID=29419 RepID=A0A5M9QRW4_9HELI|nr:FkbM family methyltransferase [Helicobacter canis]